MAKFLIKEIFLPERPYFLNLNFSWTLNLLIELKLSLSDIRMEEKSIIFTQLRSFRNLQRFTMNHSELSFHISDKFHKKRSIRCFLLILQMCKYIIVIPIDELSLENLKSLNQWLIVLANHCYFLLQEVILLHRFFIECSIFISFYLSSVNLFL